MKTHVLQKPKMKALSLAVVAAMMVMTPSSYAQQNTESSAESNDTESIEFTEQERELEEVVVSGSRIQRPEFSQPTPIISIGKEEIQRYGTPDIGSILAELPAVGATGTLAGNTSASPGGGNATAGISSPDLRRLGLNRTLTLVDGKRHVAGVGGSAQVNLATIPTALIERVDILTGGASAVYGSDAVSGVVNVILRDDYEGFSVDISGNSSTESVGDEAYSASLAAGFNFADDRGNLALFANYDKVGRIFANDIRQFENFGTVDNPDNTGENDGIPDRLTVPNLLLERINGNGVFFGGPTGFITFDNAGNPVNQTLRNRSSGFAFGDFPNGCQFCARLEDYEDFLPETDRTTVGFNVKYDINENLRAYGSVKYTESDVVQSFQPIFRFFNVVVNVQDNAFLNEGLRQQFLDQGTNFAPFSKFFDELGQRFADNDREIFQGHAGLKGDFSLGGTEVNFDVYYSNGRSENIRRTPNALIEDNFAAALDSVIDPVTGQAVCRSLTAGSVNPGACVPYNPFGFNQSSQAAQDFVSATVQRDDIIKQEVLNATFVTDTGEFLNLPGGPIDLVVGFEYREESSRTITDPVTQSGVLTNAATPNSFGEFDVTEFFTEVSLPLLKESRFGHELTVDAALRVADYSPFGSADAWKVGLLYAPVESFRVRGTIGQAVRAPNIGEAFDPLSPGFENVADPCDVDRLGDDPDRAGNCAALGLPANFQANDAVSIDILSGGNPNLTPEESDSFTAGFVWQPTFLEDFSLSVDYYDIEITDAITFVTAQNVLDNCVDATGGPDANFCSQIQRDPTTLDVSLVTSGNLNAAALNTAGYEIKLDYRNLGLEALKLPGALDFRVIANFVDELEEFDFQDRPDEINVEVGELGDPEFQYTFNMTYRLDNLSATWSTRHIDRVARFDVSPGADIPEDINPAFVESQTTHDLNFNYLISDNISVYGGVRNIFDDVPPGLTNNVLYDLVGRRVNFGVRANF